jgi:hypothetical protein
MPTAVSPSIRIVRTLKAVAVMFVSMIHGYRTYLYIHIKGGWQKDGESIFIKISVRFTVRNAHRGYSGTL